jgi:HdeA/HdeB family
LREMNGMRRVFSHALAGLALFAGFCAPVELRAQAVNSRTIDQYTCKDIMREHGSNRDVTIAFLHGYLLGKSGTAAFDVDALHKQTNDFIEHCLDNPNEKAVDAMAGLKR